MRRRLLAGAALAAMVFAGSLADVRAVGTALLAGRANYAAPSHGSSYLAIRADRGTLVKICGAGSCWTTRSTDYGPAKRTGDVADIALVRFAEICGWSVARARQMGECDVTIEFLGESIVLPATDTEWKGVWVHRETPDELRWTLLFVLLVVYVAFKHAIGRRIDRRILR